MPNDKFLLIPYFCKLNSNTNGNTIRDRKGKSTHHHKQMKGGFYMSKKGIKNLVLHLQPEPAQQLFLPKRLRKIKRSKLQRPKKAEAARSDYRNTERGKYEKNSQRYLLYKR